MKIQEIYKKYDYTPPIGSLDYSANALIIFDVLSQKGVVEEIEVTQREFSSIFSGLKDEILVSMLLDNTGKTMNEYFKSGVEIRGLKIKVM